MLIRKMIAAAAMLAAATAAQAAPVFFDDFDGQAQGLNQNAFSNGWTVSDGTVDVIPVGSDWNLLPGHGNSIDLDGSTGQAGLFTNSSVFLAAGSYTMTYTIAGNMRGAADDTVTVVFGDQTSTLVLASGDALSTKTLSYTAAADGFVTFSFHNAGGDNQGAILDSVSIAAVPEPETYAMLLAGLAGIGFVARRRRQA